MSHLNMLNTAVLPLQISPVQTSTTVPTASTRTLGVLLIVCFVLTQPWEVVLAGQYSLWRTDWLQLTTVLQPQSPQ